MRVLHISPSDNLGGSARSAYRIHQGLRRLGVRSRMLVGLKTMDDDADVGLIAGRRLWMLDRACDRLTERLSLQYLCYPSSFALPWRRWFRDSDVVQLYNTHGNYFSHTALPLISRRRPVVWRLSDMWPMTGHCAYSFACERWQTGCGACPILGHYPSLRADTTAALWRVKSAAYKRSRLTIVAPSRWMAGLAQQSPLLRRFRTHVIPNGLDTSVFRPIAKPSAREALGLNPAGRYVLFGAHFASEHRKGGSVLVEALERLPHPERQGIELLLIGRETDRCRLVGSPAGADPSSPRAARSPEGYRVRAFGPIRDDALLAIIYSAADVFVLPTLADNLPNTVLESMACATPVVSFDVGGVPDAVRHLETGYLARREDAADLARGLQQLLRNAALRERLGRRGREIVEQEYTMELQATRFAELYREVLSG